MTAWSLWRLVKLVGLVTLAGGVVALHQPTSRAARIGLLYRWILPGWALSWIAGWMLLHERGLSPGEPWVLAGIVLSLGTLHLAFLSSFLELARGITWGLALGALVGLRSPTLALECDDTDRAVAATGSRWLARGEGLTPLVLHGIMMPLRKLLHIELPGG